VRIDHVIWATRDLDATTGRLAREHGLSASGGGRHAGIGTHNGILPLGGGYLEVLAIADPEEAKASWLGRAVAAAPEGLLGWAVGVDDVAAHAQRLGLELTTIERDGFSARLTGVAEAMAEPFLPFFIERGPAVPDPGSGGDAGGIAWIEVAGDHDRTDVWLGGADLPIRYALDGPPGVRAVGLESGAVIR
jgi:hypothetical protein